MRKTELNRYNRKRGRIRLVERYGLQAQVCRVLPRLVCQPDFYASSEWRFAVAGALDSILSGGPEWKRVSDPAHVPGRGMGGTNATAADQVPLCSDHHREHDSGKAGKPAFEAKYDVNLRHFAGLLATEIAIAKGRDHV